MSPIGFMSITAAFLNDPDSNVGNRASALERGLKHNNHQLTVNSNKSPEPEPEQIDFIFKSLPTFSLEERQQLVLTSTERWIAFVRASNYEQALQYYQEEYVDALDAAGPWENLMALLEHCLIKRNYREALSILERLQINACHIGGSSSHHLRLLAFITGSITGNPDSSISPNLLQEFWSYAQACSRQLQSLLLESACLRAEAELANGKRKSARKILSTLKREPLVSVLDQEYEINSLLQMADTSSLQRALRKTGNYIKRAGHVKYHKIYACAVDSVLISAKGRVVVINGWHIDKHSPALTIGITKKSRICVSNSQLIQRSERADLVGIEQRYGASQGSLSSFTCTLIFDQHEALDLKNGELAEILISANGSITRLFCKATHQDLQLRDIRTIVRQLMSNDLRINNYRAAKNIRSIWRGQITEFLHQTIAHHTFGARKSKPDISIIIPLYGRVDFMEFQLHWFFYSQRRQTNPKYCYQIIYCLDNPSQKDEVLMLAEKCSMLYKASFEIIISPANLGYAGANNLASKYAKAETLLLLNSDILPRDDDAIDTLVTCYQSMPNNKGILGAKLLYPSGDIQHIGMSFFKDPNLPGLLASCWLNDHPHKHIKHTLSSVPQGGVIETEAATAACMLISKEVFDQLGGFRLDFIGGDFEDSDLCLRVRKIGGSVMVCLDAVFYHLERQSMVLQSNHDQEALKMVAFNAYTHHELQASIIEAMKTSLSKSCENQKLSGLMPA